jgi:hypothetical protein
MHHSPTLLLFVSIAMGCAPGALGPGDGQRPDGPPLGGYTGPDPTCPIDPDCHIGGDCSLYECPDHWECEDRPDGGEVCVSPGPDYPDDGSGSGWECYDEFDQTVCRREGGEVPDGGSDGEWSCERSGEFVECRRDDPDYPDGGSGGPWSCWYEREFRVCERDTPDDGDGPGGGDGGDGGREHCVGDACAPPICEDYARGMVTFIDDRDESNDGEIWALGDGTRDSSCATVTVDVTGYYQVFDKYIAESCTRQLDETGFLTIKNSCNAAGEPVEENVGDHFVVGDVDNTMECTSDAECGGGMVCRVGTRASCCVSTTPTFMGTFLLKAGEPNELCLTHWCPLYRAGREADGFVNDGCGADKINSIHLVLDGTTFACVDDRALPSGCE